LYFASKYGNEQIVNTLLKHKANVNAADNYGLTPLYWASRKGHESIVNTLVEHKANVNAATTDDGTTPLWIASQKGHESIVKTLIDNGAKITIKNNNGETPLDIADNKMKCFIIKSLIDLLVTKKIGIKVLNEGYIYKNLSNIVGNYITKANDNDNELEEVYKILQTYLTDQKDQKNDIKECINYFTKLYKEHFEKK